MDKRYLTIKGLNKFCENNTTGEFKDILHNLHQIYMQSMFVSYGSVETKPKPKEVVKMGYNT
jgi:hypothetical protein